MESVTIKGVVYENDCVNYEIHDGVVYVCDQNHSGVMALSQDAKDKYAIDDDMVEDMGDEANNVLGDYYDPEFPYHLSFYHCCGIIDPETGEVEMDTPHGETYEEPFVAWYNDIPVGLFAEDEIVQHLSYCDG